MGNIVNYIKQTASSVLFLLRPPINQHCDNLFYLWKHPIKFVYSRKLQTFNEDKIWQLLLEVSCFAVAYVFPFSWKFFCRKKLS